MKKILPLIFVAVLMVFAVAQTSQAEQWAGYPDGTQNEYIPYYEFDGYDSVVITYGWDGAGYATALDVNGLPDSYYYFMYLSASGYLYCSADGWNWDYCPY